jgi:hypothetical protein
LPEEDEQTDDVENDGDPDNADLPDVLTEGQGGTTSVSLSGTSEDSDVVSAHTVGTASSGQAGTVCSDAVALQLAQMLAALQTLTRRFDDTRIDVADLREELRSFKAQTVSLSAGSEQ